MFDTKFASFFDGCVAIYNAYMDETFALNTRDKFSFKRGGRYVKVIKGGGVHCFVDTTNGNVLKPASWRAPAKHARGNVFDASNGLGSMGPYGPAYLR